ncbi:MAG: biotin--[acetyl-CoA-carboxylase] ligase [Acidothermus sp.]|nr:biotin--[acetyl-CoA-carboxylase] ligase [Acidothermus sp.]
MAASSPDEDPADAYRTEILAACASGPAAEFCRFEVVAETDSTNADVAAAARRGEAEGLVVVADFQRAGRGRFGRRWVAPPGTALMFSLLLRPSEVPMERWPLLPLLAGVGVVRGLAATCGVRLGLKWPNDVVDVGGRKLAGILVEAPPTEASARAAVVVGTGLNVFLSTDMPPGATALNALGARPPSRGVILRGILEEFLTRYRAWRNAEPERVGAVLAEYRRFCTTIGAEVEVELPGGEIVAGRAVDVTSNGALLVATTRGDVALNTAEVVRVRRVAVRPDLNGDTMPT